MSLLENAAKITEQGSQVISQGTAALGQGKAALGQGVASLGQGLENIKNIKPKDIVNFGKELGSQAMDFNDKRKTILSNLNPMNIISEFDREIKGVFRKVKSNACKMANTKEFSQIIEMSVIDNIKQIAEGKPPKNEGYGFFENLYMTLFLALMKYDNPASRLFMVDEYRFLILDIKNLNNQLLENTDNSITDKELEKIGIKINQKEDLLKSLVQNTLSKNEIFVSMLLNHSGFLTAMCKNEIFLKQIVEKKIFSTYGNEFTVQFVKQSKRKISKKELTKNEVKAFLKALNDISLNKGIQILAEKKETGDGQEGGNLADMAKEAVGDINTSSVTGAVENIDAIGLENTKKEQASGIGADSSEKGDEPESDIPETIDDNSVPQKTNNLSNTKNFNFTNMSEIPPEFASKFGLGLGGPSSPQPLSETDNKSYPYMDLLKIKNQVSNTFARIREKICDILGRREFHEKLKESVFVEIEPQIQKHMNSLNIVNQQNPIGNPENENFYKTYQKLFRYLNSEEKTREDVYQELEKYFKSILKKIQKMELETNLILKQKNDEELGRLKECLNQFIEHVVMDNVFMTYLFENRDFCSVVFHHESFFDYIVYNLDENGFMGFLVEYWTTYRESDLENGNINTSENTVNQNLTEEEKEDKQAIEEEGEKIEDESANEAEKKKKQQENIVKEKRKKYRDFLLNLNRKLAPSDTMFGLFNGGEQDAQMGGACSDNIIKILEIDQVDKIHKRLQNVIETSNIIDSYGLFLYKSIEKLQMEDVMNLYKETLPPKGASDIFQETELFKNNNNMYIEGDNNQDGIVSQLSGKGKEHLFMEFIASFPDSKGYEVLIRYILTAEKLKHNRFFLFRKLFEMMGETDMIEFVSEYTAICEKVPDVKQSNLRKGLGEGLGKVGEGLGKVGEGLGKGLGKVGEGLGKVGKPVGDWVKKHYPILSRDGIIDFKNDMNIFVPKIQKDIQNNEFLNETGEKMKSIMPGNTKDNNYFDSLNRGTEEYGKSIQEKVKNIKTKYEPTSIKNYVNSLIGNTDEKLINNVSDSFIKKNLPLNENTKNHIKKQYNNKINIGEPNETTIGEEIIKKIDEKRVENSQDVPEETIEGGGLFGKKTPKPPDTLPPPGNPPPETPPPGTPLKSNPPPGTPLQSKKSPKEVVKQISAIVSSGNVVAFLDPGLLSNLLRVDTINLLMEPQTIINFLKLVNKELLEKMTAEIPNTITKIIEKLKEIVKGVSVDLKDSSVSFIPEATPDEKSGVKIGGADKAPETTTPETMTKAPESETIKAPEPETKNPPETKDTDTVPESETKDTDPEAKTDKKITITQKQIEEVVQAVPGIIKEKTEKLEKNIIRLGVSNIPLLIKLYYLKEPLLKFNEALTSNIQKVNVGELLDIFQKIDFAKILGISDDKLTDLIKKSTSDGANLFSNSDLSDLKNQLPGLLGNLGLEPAVLGNLTNKIKNQDAAQKADADAEEKENEPEPECSSKLNQLLERMQKKNGGRPIDELILKTIIEHSVTEKNIEYLFEKEVIQKMPFPAPEIKNTVKRMIALILGMSDLQPVSIEKRKESQINYKESIMKEVLNSSSLSNYNLRKVIVMVFENLSKNPKSVSYVKSEHPNTGSVYLESMRQFYTGYILKKGNENRNPKEVEKKLVELMDHMQKYSDKSGLGVLKDRSKPLDKLRYVCRNKQNTTMKRMPGNSSRMKSYKKIDVNKLNPIMSYIPGSKTFYKNMSETIYDINNASEPIRNPISASPVGINSKVPVSVPTKSMSMASTTMDAIPTDDNKAENMDATTTDSTNTDKNMDENMDKNKDFTTTDDNTDENNTVNKAIDNTVDNTENNIVKENKIETPLKNEKKAKAEAKAIEKKEDNERILKEFYERIDNKPYYKSTTN